MRRRALIIYCDNTPSGPLHGPKWDNANFRDFLQSKLGGEWHDNEIRSLNNPNSAAVSYTVQNFFKGADYSFIIFSGHGFINSDDDNRQYVELLNKSVSILSLRTSARRQTLIIDACRGYYSPARELLKAFSESRDHFLGDIESTREFYSNIIMSCEEGWTILYSASRNQTSLDTATGGAYLISLLKGFQYWEENDQRSNILDLRVAHQYATNIIKGFETTQIPTMNMEKRLRYFPIAVKSALIYS
jgi:hypothetical protein